MDELSKQLVEGFIPLISKTDEELEDIVNELVDNCLEYRHRLLTCIYRQLIKRKQEEIEEQELYIRNKLTTFYIQRTKQAPQRQENKKLNTKAQTDEIHHEKLLTNNEDGTIVINKQTRQDLIESHNLVLENINSLGNCKESFEKRQAKQEENFPYIEKTTNKRENALTTPKKKEDALISSANLVNNNNTYNKNKKGKKLKKEVNNMSDNYLPMDTRSDEDMCCSDDSYQATHRIAKQTQTQDNHVIPMVIDPDLAAFSDIEDQRIKDNLYGNHINGSDKGKSKIIDENNVAQISDLDKIAEEIQNIKLFNPED